MNRNLSSAAEQDEQVVTEVHCAESGLPIPSIPAWYATVNVKFVSEAYRQKSPRAAAPVDYAETEPARGALENDGEMEIPMDEIEIDDMEMDESEDASEE